MLSLETDSFTVFEHKTKILVGCQICCTYIYQSSFTNVYTVTTNINVTVHIKSALQFIVTSSKKHTYIHTYSLMCIVVVHSDVHLSSSTPSFLP